MRRWGYLIGLICVFVAGTLAGPLIRPESSPQKPIMSSEMKGIASSYSTRAKPENLFVETPGWTQPRNFGFLLLILCCCFWIVQRQASRALDRRARNEASDTRALSTSSAPVTEAPRELLRNPYSPDIVGLDFEARVQFAIEASLRASRVIGVIHFRLVDPKHDDIRDASLDFMARALGRQIRPSDCVRVSKQGLFEIYISLLSTRDDLYSIAARMAKTARKLESESGLKLAYQPGCAIYPLDGYHAAELAQAARVDALSRLSVLPPDEESRPHAEPALFYPGAARAL